MTTKARPGSKVLVTGAGPVGLLAALVFQKCGYEVFVSDPLEERIRIARESGIIHASRCLPVDDPYWYREVALALDCSGHEAAVQAGCEMVRKGGEVVLAGVPWKRNSELYAHELLSVVFHRYVILRSGWEWEIPMFHQDFAVANTTSNFQTGMRWLAEGLFDPHLYLRMASPADAQTIYAGLANRSIQELFVIFDWKKIEEEKA